VSFNRNTEKREASANIPDLARWLQQEASLNGLAAADQHPWHLVVTYDQFDEDGDNIHSGTYEEYWVGPKKFKRIYKSDTFNQADYATEKGLYRRGDQQWPDRSQLQVRSEIVDPFSYAYGLQGLHGRSVERVFSGYKLQCTATESNTGLVHPPEYCFEPNSSILRYNSGFGWNQVVHNRIVSFQGRNLARDVDVTNAGKPYLMLRVKTIELISQVNDADFLPPPEAIAMGDRVSGVQPVAISTSYPRWPTSLAGQHFTVTVEIIIGKGGHVLSARQISGPPDVFRFCEDAVREWVFQPYLILGEPVEVQQTVSFRH